MAEAGLALMLRALAFAAHKRRDQRRKDAGASPYINHPIALAEVLRGAHPALEAAFDAACCRRPQ